MRQVLSVSKPRTFPSWKQWQQISRVLQPKERFLLRGAMTLAVCSLLSLGGWYVSTHRVDIPAAGGSYTEGLIGEPQYINPLYASSSDVDADLTRLVFSGLMRIDPNEGLVKDLAEQIDMSEDGKTYTIRLRDGARFQNGDDVRARDVIFTFEAIQNPQYRSQLAVTFRGVTVSQVDDKTVSFQLDEPFAPFLSTLTVGILPANVWSDVMPRNAPLASRNLEPIGSGPYKFAKFSKDKKGAILSYTLERNTDYYGEKPLIDQLTFKFYPDADSAVQALDNRYVEGVSFVPPDAESDVEKNHAVNLVRPNIPRETTLFFNQDKNTFLKKPEIRKAIAMAIDKQAIVDDAVHGHATVINSPILPGMIGYRTDVAEILHDREGANTLLEESGYPRVEGSDVRQTEKDSTENPLSFTLTTVQNPEFVRAAELIRDQLAAVGIGIDIRSIDADTFFVDVIEPHDYELLLTGLLLGADPDPYPFWHSSQTKDGGLNLSLYANRTADTLLEEARRAVNPEDRVTKYREFEDLIAKDIPAIFLYQPQYAYAIASRIRGVDIPSITTPSDRFANIVHWYIKTKKVLR